jgi:SAM-dependent MidA family methyltransferase
MDTTERLQEAIAERIRAEGGRIPFAVYMELSLYDSAGGYYQNNRPKVGKEGDFYTSAHIGSVMGQCIAVKLHKEAERMAPNGEPIAIIEWGGGDGKLGEAVLDELRSAYPDTYKRCVYLGAEGSPYHRDLQLRRLEGHSERIEGVVSPDDPLVDQTMRDRISLVYANELLDAFAVYRLRKSQGEWKELYVGLSETGDFEEQLGPISDARTAALLERYKVEGSEGQTIEVGQASFDWLRRLGERMGHGFVLLSDYGDVSEQLLAPHRMNGTFLCYRDHVASDNPYQYAGGQDMTAHVNFEWCMDAAEEAGFQQVELVTQKQFLVEQGILERLQQHAGTDPFSPEARTNRAIRQLLLSDGMSELFKVMTMHKAL